MDPFIYNSVAARVIFGSGTLRRLPAEVERLGLLRVLVLTPPQRQTDGRAPAEQIGAGAADIVLDQPYWNPRRLDRGAIRDLLARAYAGEPSRL